MAKIRIIDDDVEQSACLSEVLRRAGHEVTTFDRIAGALESLEGDRPDLVVLDVMFPENVSGGLELAIKIRQNDKTKHLPVILLTNINKEFAAGFSSKDIDPQWMPVQTFLEKPVDFQMLLRKVEELVKKP
jgi:CheY-like chemotaxis protein